MTQRLICLSVGFGGHEFMKDLFRETLAHTSKIKLTPNDVVLFEGGVDISPRLYKQNPGNYTQSPHNKRDNYEVSVWQEAQDVGASCFGICRGAQLFCALSGGSLIQHVSGHNSSHKISTSDGETIYSSSVHHQMMAPGKVPHTLLAWSSENRSNVYLGENNKDVKDLLSEDLYLEPEAIWFPKTRSLGVQGHPEFMPDGHEYQKYCRKLVQNHLLVTN